MSCLTSDSVSWDPVRAKPVFSSSYVIVPLLSVSMFVNIVLRPLISSSDRFCAMTYEIIQLLEENGRKNQLDPCN